MPIEFSLLSEGGRKRYHNTQLAVSKGEAKYLLHLESKAKIWKLVIAFLNVLCALLYLGYRFIQGACGIFYVPLQDYATSDSLKRAFGEPHKLADKLNETKFDSAGNLHRLQATYLPSTFPSKLFHAFKCLAGCNVVISCFPGLYVLSYAT